MSKVINWEDRSTAVLFGDGAGGLLLEHEDEDGEDCILAEDLHSDGVRYLALTANQKNVQNPFHAKEENQPIYHPQRRIVRTMFKMMFKIRLKTTFLMN